MLCPSCGTEITSPKRCLKCGASLSNTNRFSRSEAATSDEIPTVIGTYRRDLLMPFKRLGLRYGLAVYFGVLAGPALAYAALFEPRNTPITLGKIGLALLALAVWVLVLWYLNKVTKVPLEAAR